jgi:hypothetical protein
VALFEGSYYEPIRWRNTLNDVFGLQYLISATGNQQTGELIAVAFQRI